MTQAEYKELIKKDTIKIGEDLEIIKRRKNKHDDTIIWEANTATY